MHHPEIAGAVPSVLEGFFTFFQVFEVALHDGVSPQHQFSQGFSIRGNGFQGFRITNPHPIQGRINHSLACFLGGTSFEIEVIPGFLPGTDGGRSVNLGQAVEVNHFKTHWFEGSDHRAGRSRSAGGDHDFGFEAKFHLLGSMGHRVENDGRAALMGHSVFFDESEHRRRVEFPQADMGRTHRTHAPGEAPAVAVKHRQGPEVDRVASEPDHHRVAHCRKIGSPVMADDPLGISCGA